MEILLSKNKGYEWFETPFVKFKGYFQLKDGLKVYRGMEAINLLKEINSEDQFNNFLKKIDGCYSIIIDKGDIVFGVVDKSRSMPLFVASNGSIISDNAEEIRKYLGIPREGVDKDNLIELYANYYLFGHKTVYKEIQQLDLGEICQIKKGSIHFAKYFWHLNDNYLTDDKEQIKKKLSEVSYRTFERIKSVISGRPVVLSMSGGYDSRFVGCMLKNVGIEDVSCYTYGKADSFEVIQSKKNAEALGFRWKCVEMTDEVVTCSIDNVGQKYIEYNTGHDFTAYMQNFPAVRKLYEEGWFKPGSVFLTGLCGDMPTGEYVEQEKAHTYNIDDAVSYLHKKVFTRFALNDKLKNQWRDEMYNTLKELPIEINSYQSYQSAIDCIYTGTCHSHWYMNMNTVHSFFGFEWLLPYWDAELLKLWYSIPAKFRVNQNLYEEWLMEDICAKYGIGQKKKMAKYSSHKWLSKLKYRLGIVANYVALNLGFVLRRKYDYSNFAPLELAIFKRIQNKKLVIFRRGGMMHFLCHYILEKRYGVENIKYVRKRIKSLV